MALLLILFTVSNLIFYLNTQYVGIPTTTEHLRAALRQSLELVCQYKGIDGNGEFLEWYKDGAPVSQDKPGHYVVKTTEAESKLIIKIFVKADSEVKNWTVKTNKAGNHDPPQCQFGQIYLKPSPQGFSTNRTKEKLDSAHGSVRRNELETLHLTCLIDPPTDKTNPVRWEFSKDDNTYVPITNEPEITVQDNEIHINPVKKFHRGYYRCTLNDVSFGMLLRVKDRLAALWPLIGIVGVVFVLVVIILIFEKRQKANKKTHATDDDDQDQANDPLVRTTVASKTSDNDNRKRAVKA